MSKAKSPSTTNVVSITSARRAVAPPAQPTRNPARSPEAVLITALLLQLREGNKASRRRFIGIQWQVGQGANRHPDDPAFSEASRMLDVINGAVLDREIG